MRPILSAFLALALAFPALAQDAVPLAPSGGNFTIAEVDEVTIIKVKRLLFRSVPFTLAAPVDDNIASYKWIVPPGMVATDRDDKLEVTAAAKGEWLVEVKYKLGIVDGGKIKYTTKTGSLKFLVGEVPPPLPPTPPPVPPTPPMPPPDPPIPPQPVVSFRVILVQESGDTLTGAQKSVFYGKTVEDFLNATCTGGKAGWRRRDKDMPGENDPAMAQVWSAVKGEFAAPKNTKTPAVVVQVNSKIEIIPLAATPVEMVAILKKYAEGK